MNKDRRKRLDALIDKLGELLAELDEIQTEEGEAFENMPESIQQSERGTTMESFMDLMENARIDIESAIESLNEVVMS